LTQIARRVRRKKNAPAVGETGAKSGKEKKMLLSTQIIGMSATFPQGEEGKRPVRQEVISDPQAAAWADTTADVKNELTN